MRRLANQFLGMRFSIVATVAVCLLAAASQVRLSTCFCFTTHEGKEFREMDPALFCLVPLPVHNAERESHPIFPT